MSASDTAVRPPRTSVVCWDAASEESLRAALSMPTTQCVETGLSSEGQHDLTDLEDEAGHLSLIVSTRSAYRHPIVKTFLTALEERAPVSEDLRIRIYSAVQEALMNAVLHGNLRLDSKLRNSLDGLAEAEEQIDAKLRMPEIGQKMIRLDAAWNRTILQVTVHDSGIGYAAANTSSEAFKGVCGRGLAILRAFCDGVAVLDGGTTVEMEFTI